MVTFVGIVFSALLMAVQFASAQVTPRALKLSLNDPVTKAALGIFVATFLYALVVMARIRDDFVPQLALLGVSALAIVSILVLLLLVSHIIKALRPGQVIALVGRLGRETLGEMYPEESGRRATAPPSRPPRSPARPPGGSSRTTGLPASSACDVGGLVAKARRADARLVLLPAVGDFVPRRSPLFQVCETGIAVNERLLRASVALARERTLEQDPTFAFRILVDVAIRALSPAVKRCSAT